MSRAALIRVVGVCGLAALLLAPGVWSLATLTSGDAGMIRSAGPRQANARGGAGGAGGAPTSSRNSTNTTLVAYLQAHQGAARYLVATLDANTAAPLILATGRPVMSLGGLLGSDPILTTSQLQRLIATG